MSHRKVGQKRIRYITNESHELLGYQKRNFKI